MSRPAVPNTEPAKPRDMAQAAHGWGCVAGASLVGAFWASGALAVLLAVVAVFFWAVGFLGARLYDRRRS